MGKNKSKKNTGREFESLTKLVFDLISHNEKNTHVEKDVLLESPDGKRQFDVVIRSKVAGLDLLTVIECRDFAKKISITHLDGFNSKVQDVNASKAVLISSGGFTKGAKRKAKRLGITLCTLHDLERGIKNIGMEIPVIVMSVDAIKLNFSMVCQLDKGDTIDIRDPLLIDGIPINDAISSALLENRIPVDKFNETIVWEPLDDEETIAHLIVDNDRKIPLERLEINVILRGGYFFGYVTDLPGTIGLVNLTQEEKRLFIKKDDINVDYKKHFERYVSLEDIPRFSGVNISVIKMPKIEYDISGFEFNVIKRLRS